MLYVDKKYLLLASTYLVGFVDSGNNVYRFRCPFCGDSKKNKNKTRGYLYPIQDSCAFKCHNCGAGLGLGKFIKHLSFDLYQQYVFERFVSPKKRPQAQRPIEAQPFSFPEKAESEVPVGLHKILKRCEPVVDLDDDHPAKAYLNGRRIPSEQQARLYYTDDIGIIARSIDRYRDRDIGKTRAVVIPYFDDRGELTFVQTRAIDDTTINRYVVFEVDGGEKIWNLDQVDWDEHVFVLEGAFDAMFLKNAIAVASSNSMLPLVKYLRERCKAGFTFVFDRDYTDNMQVFEQFHQAVTDGHSVVFYDAKFQSKDINEAVIQGLRNPDEYLMANRKHGLSAMLELSKLKINKVFNDQQKKKRSKARSVL